MTNDDPIISDGEIRSPERARKKLRGGERARRRSRSRSRGRHGHSKSPERRRLNNWSPRRRSPESRRRPETSDTRRPRDRSPATRDRPLTNARTTSSAPQVVLVTQRHLSSSEHHHKLRRYDEADEVVLVSSAPESKPKQQRMRETFDDYDHPNKRQKPLETSKVDILKHQPVLSLDDQSTEGFMDLDVVLASLTNLTTTTKPRKSLSFATQETSLDMITEQGIHSDRMRCLSDDTHMDIEDNDITPSYIFEAPKFRGLGPQNSNFILIPVRDRRWKAKTAGPPTPSILAASLAQHNDSWGIDDWGAPAHSAPVSQSTVAASYSSAQYDYIFAEPLDGSSMPPPLLTAASSNNCVPSSPIPRIVSPVDPAGSTMRPPANLR